MMDLSVEESIDFDFFDERPQRECENVTQPVSALKPPLPPDSTKQLPKSDNSAKDNQHGNSDREAGSSSGSDSSRDTSPECSSRSASEEDVSRSSDTGRINAVKSQNSRSRSSSTSSAGSSVDSDSSTDSEQMDSYGSQSKSKTSNIGRGKDLQSAADSGKQPTNPLAEPIKQTMLNRDRHQVNSEYSSKTFSDNKGSKLGNTVSYQKGTKYPDETSGNRDTKQAWHEVKGTKGKKQISVVLRRSKTNTDRPKTAVERSDTHSSTAQHHRSRSESDSNSDSDITDTKEVWHEVKGTKGKKQMSVVLRRSKTNIDRPKTAVTRSDKHSVKTQPHRSRSESDSNSDSDITDVSSIETPSNEIEDRYKQKIGAGARMTDAGDGHPVKLQFKPVSYDNEKDSATNNYDPDKITGFDLKLLMKAVGELEKQSKVQLNSRRVMFAPATLKGSEKSNYTFDKNQTRDIERENHRLLREIIRQVNSGEQKKHFSRQPGSYRLTPSAVNRERDIQRIERENLAFLKRLQDVKPTKSICRDNQLRAYESTVFCGVPIAALQHRPNGKRVRCLAADSADTSSGGRAESASSISSIGSSVRSMGSGRSSRPTSAKSGFSVKRLDSRPAWTDRW